MFSIIPQPHRMQMSDTPVALPPRYTAAAFPDAARTLCDYAARIHDIRFEEGIGGIRLTRDDRLPPEGYTVTVTDAGAAVAAADALGAQNAVATLIQLMQRTETGFALPQGTIEDAPECTWRGIMIDLARDWHEPEVLYEYVDLCRFYKIRYLHLHFTDDQSYTLPTKAFPKLSTPGRHYPAEELQRLIDYAISRGVEIIPEIDVPGHCTSFAAGYGEIFGTNGIISLSDASMNAMKDLFRELCGMFPHSNYIHIGGDEAAIGKWTEDETCLAAFRARGVDVDGMEKRALAEVMYATFIREMCETVLACGKTPVVWEGFAAEVNHLIPREAVIMSWENFYQTTPSLMEAGFRLVNCSWVPMYVVAPVVERPVREVFDWDVYHWTPVHPQSPYLHTGLAVEPTAQIEGGQLLAWGDQIERSYSTVAEGVRDERRMIEERTPALAENTWSRTKRLSWEEFCALSERTAALCGKLKA